MFILENIENYEQLKKFIETEKKDRDYYKESQIQNMVVKFLIENNIDFHPSMSGLKATRGQARFMKSQGIRAGHPDLIIEKKANGHEILFLELKTIKGKLSDFQIDWIKKKIKDGYAVSVSYGYYDAIYKIKKYLEGEPIIDIRFLDLKTDDLDKIILENRHAEEEE